MALCCINITVVKENVNLDKISAMKITPEDEEPSLQVKCLSPLVQIKDSKCLV